MGRSILIKNTCDEIIYNGAFFDIPIKEDAIISKCIELYSEDDPCILYRTYAEKTIKLQLLKELIDDNSGKVELLLNAYKSELISCINLPDINNSILVIEE